MPFKQGKSVNDLNARIKKFTEEEIPARIKSEMYVLLTNLGAYADFYVPIDTKALVNSRNQTVAVEGGLVVGTVGYYTAYAEPLHSPTPGGKMDGWKPKPVPSPGKQTGGFNADAKQGWLNIAWEWKGVELIEEFNRGVIR